MTRGAYATRDDAAIAALTLCFPVSIDEDREYGGLVWHDGQGGYGHTPPITGSSMTFPITVDWSLVDVPPDTSEVGCYHTHGDFTVFDPDLQRLVRVPRERATRSGRGLGVYGRDGDFWSNQDIFVITGRGASRPGYRGYLGTSAMIIRYYDPGTGAEGALFPRAPVANQRRSG